MLLSKPKISIIIVHLFNAQQLLDCLKSVFKSDHSDFEVVVVFNGSLGGSFEAVKREFPQVITIQNEKNLGFAKANNQGIKKSRGEVIFLLNDDTTIDAHLLSVLSGELWAGSDIGIVGPKIYYMDEPDRIWFAGGWIDWKKQDSFHYGQKTKDIEYKNDSQREVDFITGCALMIKREVIDKIGLLDETFFAFFEDADWCQRAKKAGYKVAYIPYGGVWHKKSATASQIFFGAEKEKNFLWLAVVYLWRYWLKEARKYRNKFIFYSRYLSGRLKIIFILKYIFISTLRFIWALLVQAPQSLFKIIGKHI